MSGQSTHSKTRRTPAESADHPDQEFTGRDDASQRGGESRWPESLHEPGGDDQPGWASRTAHAAGDAVMNAGEAVGGAVSGMVHRYPASATVLAAGVGFGIGTLVGMLFARPAQKKGSMARFGQSVWEAMAHCVPGSLKK